MLSLSFLMCKAAAVGELLSTPAGSRENWVTALPGSQTPRVTWGKVLPLGLQLFFSRRGWAPASGACGLLAQILGPEVGEGQRPVGQRRVQSCCFWGSWADHQSKGLAPLWSGDLISFLGQSPGQPPPTAPPNPEGLRLFSSPPAPAQGCPFPLWTHIPALVQLAWAPPPQSQS